MLIGLNELNRYMSNIRFEWARRVDEELLAFGRIYSQAESWGSWNCGKLEWWSDGGAMRGEQDAAGESKKGYQRLPGSRDFNTFFWLPWVTVSYRKLPNGYWRVTGPWPLNGG